MDILKIFPALLVVLATGLISAEFTPQLRKKVEIQNIDTIKFSSCIYNEENESVSCKAAKGPNETTFHNVYKQCRDQQPGTGEKIGVLPQVWGPACILWQKSPTIAIGSHRSQVKQKAM